jgi:hypothetical protein
VGKSKSAERTPCAPARVVQIERTTLEPFRPSTEGCARRHIRDLQLQDFRGGRSAAEQYELDNLKTRYPDLPLDPDDPFTEAIEEIRLAESRKIAKEKSENSDTMRTLLLPAQGCC